MKTRPFDRSPRSAFSPNTAARTVPDWRRIPCCASLATRRPRPQKADVRGSRAEKRDAERRRRSRSKTSRPADGRDARRSASERRFYYRSSENFVNGERRNAERGTAFATGCALIKNRLLRNVIFELFEFRGEFVLFDFVVHRFFANAEFARGESTATVASDERFEKCEPFDLRQRQTGESERRRRRGVGATGRAERNRKRTRRLDGRRKRNVGDGNARAVGVCVARKPVNGASRSNRNGGDGRSGRENVAAERRLGRRGITTGKTIEGIHWMQGSERGRGKVALQKAARITLT